MKIYCKNGPVATDVAHKFYLSTVSGKRIGYRGPNYFRGGSKWLHFDSPSYYSRKRDAIRAAKKQGFEVEDVTRELR